MQCPRESQFSLRQHGDFGRVKVQCDLKKSVTGNFKKQEKEGENADLQRKHGYVIM